MTFCDLALSKRLERAEGHACVQFAEARQRLSPDSAATWMEYGGAFVVFDGVDSPVTQTFGLGLFEDLTANTLDTIEQFFFDRGANVDHEVSPLVGVNALGMLCERKYKPIEISSMLYRAVERPSEALGNITVRVTGPEQAAVWAEVSARGWAHQNPELFDFMKEFGALSAARKHSPCFLAEIDGEPGAAGVLSIHDGVALFAGAATVPELRRRGLQGALLQERMRYAADHGCDLAVMVAEAGSNSQRNAERKGFRIAYTRTKWRLSRDSA
jgi:GNAT superfamily N-acetyltransferase